MNRYRPLLLHIFPRAVSFLLLTTISIAVSAQNRRPAGSTPRDSSSNNIRSNDRRSPVAGQRDTTIHNDRRSAAAMRRPATPASKFKVQDRRPPSEKLAEKKFTWNRRLMQNLITRYNYYYHAKNKLDGIIKSIARQGLDNYYELLPFYPYSLQDQGLDKNDLDSVIIKSSVAIQLHDPRGKWIDDCYLLIGRAYFYKSDWENATKTFQFMNLTFAPKRKSDYTTVVGSSVNDQLSIATPEKRKGILGRLKHKKGPERRVFMECPYPAGRTGI